MPAKTLLTAAALALLAATTAAQAAEQLVMAPYPASPAWKTATEVRKGLKHLREQIPVDQQIGSYHDILTDQAFPEQARADPADFLRGMFSRVQGACDGVRVNGPKAATEHGYPVAYGQIYCGRQKGKPFGVHMFFKVMGGDDALYVVQRELHVPPSAQGGIQTFSKDQIAAVRAQMEAEGAANGYLVDGVHLCGPRSGEGPCP